MRLSVILANYNGARFLAETLASVAAQTRVPDELVVVDDASTDDSVGVIERAFTGATFPTRLIRHDRNRGQAAGFNTGAAAVTGELVCLLDSDDLWLPRKLEAVEAAAAAAPGFALIQHQLRVVRNAEWTDEYALPALTGGDVWKLWMNADVFPWFVPTSGLAVRGEVLRKIIPVPERLRVCADSFVTRSSICHGPVIALHECLGGYRQHGENNVAGNPRYDAREFFYREVRPLLHHYYGTLGFPSPVARLQRPRRTGLLDRLLDLSPRKILRRVPGFERWTD